jgi:hypothetical protein
MIVHGALFEYARTAEIPLIGTPCFLSEAANGDGTYMQNRVIAAIVGPGNIGTDLLAKLRGSSVIDVAGCQRSLRTPGRRPGVVLAGGQRFSRPLVSQGHHSFASVPGSPASTGGMAPAVSALPQKLYAAAATELPRCHGDAARGAVMQAPLGSRLGVSAPSARFIAHNAQLAAAGQQAVLPDNEVLQE